MLPLLLRVELPSLPPLLRVRGVLSEISSDRSSLGLGGLGFRMAAVNDWGGVATTLGIAEFRGGVGI